MSQTYKVAISQSNYIPWKGYFDLIAKVDEFVLFDEVQYTKRDWRNRNIVKTKDGLQWLSIPVINKGKFSQSISEVEILDSHWCEKHWTAISHNYSKAPYFKDLKSEIEGLFQKASEMKYLSQVNFLFIKWICEYLNINTKLTWSSNFTKLKNDKNERLIEICSELRATEYISGPAAKSYLDVYEFNKQGINVKFMDYTDYPVYKQLTKDFEHSVSILDLIFNEGKNTASFMKFSKDGIR